MFQELVRKAKYGDIKAKEEIIRNLQPLLVSSIRRYYYNKNELEDLMQEGNLKILESIDKYEEKKGIYFLGYVKTMLKYMYLDKHKEREHMSLNEKATGGEDEIIDLLVSEDLDISEEIATRDEIEELRDKLKELTERQREIIILFYIEKKNMHQIAEKLNISYRTVVNTKTMAIKKLRGMM